MSIPSSVAGHPIHPMLVPLPIGLWMFSLVADMVALSRAGDGPWRDVAFYTMAGGLVGAVLAAVPGLVDFTGIRAQQTRRLATFHLVLNLSLVALYAVNLWLRSTHALGEGLPVILSALGIVVLAVSGWLGGELVFVRRVGVRSSDSPTGQRKV
jgi:uncharacterized membrane protein